MSPLRSATPCLRAKDQQRMLLRLKTFERQLTKFFFGKAFVPAQRTRMDQRCRLQGIKNDRLSGAKRWHDQIKKRSEIGTKCRQRIRCNEHRNAEGDLPFSLQLQNLESDTRNRQSLACQYHECTERCTAQDIRKEMNPHRDPH